MSSARNRLLEPTDAVLLESFPHVDRLFRVVAVVGINIDFDIVADRLSNGSQSFNVFAFTLTEIFADLHLHGFESPLHITSLFGYQLVKVEVRPATAAVDGYRLGVRAE